MPDLKYRDAKSAAKELGLDEPTMLDLLRAGALPGVELGTTWLVSEASLVEFLQEEERRQLEIRRGAELSATSRPSRETRRRRTRRTGVNEFTILGEQRVVANKIDVLLEVLRKLQDRDPTFLERYSKLSGRKRRYIARDPSLLYPGRSDLASTFSTEFVDGWWIGTNIGSREIEVRLSKACEIAGLRWGADIVLGSGRSANRAKALSFVGAARDTASDVAQRHDEYLAESD